MRTNHLCLVALATFFLFTNCKKDKIVPNQAPIANAGADRTIILPANSSQLVGSGSDSDGNIATYNWTRLAGGPAEGTIVSPYKATTDVTELVQGQYAFQLEVTDDKGISAIDYVLITVLVTEDDPCNGCWDY
jgi:hypothetical protein